MDSNPLHWSKGWKEVKSLPQGGQGRPFEVKKIDDATGQSYFLKEFPTDANEERRRRMFREVACYRTLEHRGIPRLIESNADEFSNKGFGLYLVTEFVNGANLAAVVSKRGPLEPQLAIRIVGNLLDIVAYAHSQEAVHRDIKPENVMLASGSDADVVLIDFGISFLARDHDEQEELTALGQELGNRFLRLPEFRVRSLMKRDPRSDVTLCVGVLLYLLTGERPSWLSDERGLLPHQRESVRKKLAALTSIDIPALADIFDRGFDSHLDARWQSAAELADVLRRLSERPAVAGSTPLPRTLQRRPILAARSVYVEAKEVQH